MLIDKYLPRFDVAEVHELEVDAPPDATYTAMWHADLRDPLVAALFAIRDLPNRIARRARGEAPPPAPSSLTFADLATPEMGWMLLAQDPGAEFVLGSVGRFWKRDYGWREVAPEEFFAFGEPGYAKIALSLSVRAVALGRSVLRYEARTGTTDQDARMRFRRYWRVIRPGVAIVMRRALDRIAAASEHKSEPAVR